MTYYKNPQSVMSRVGDSVRRVFDKTFVFQTYTPPPDLAVFIEHFWVIRWDKVDA